VSLSRFAACCVLYRVLVAPLEKYPTKPPLYQNPCNNDSNLPSPVFPHLTMASGTQGRPDVRANMSAEERMVFDLFAGTPMFIPGQNPSG
jgi:hypothetical protein